MPVSPRVNIRFTRSPDPIVFSEAGNLLTSTDGDHQINIASMLSFNDVNASNISLNVNYFTDREMRD